TGKTNCAVDCASSPRELGEDRPQGTIDIVSLGVIFQLAQFRRGSRRFSTIFTSRLCPLLLCPLLWIPSRSNVGDLELCHAHLFPRPRAESTMPSVGTNYHLGLTCLGRAVVSFGQARMLCREKGCKHVSDHLRSRLCLSNPCRKGCARLVC